MVFYENFPRQHWKYSIKYQKAKTCLYRLQFTIYNVNIVPLCKHKQKETMLPTVGFE